VDLLKDLAILDAFLVAVNDLIASDDNTCVVVLGEPVGVVTKPLLRLHDNPVEVEGVSRAIVGRLEVGGESLEQVGQELMLLAGRLLSQSDGALPITNEK
jgi:hypothetical protein